MAVKVLAATSDLFLRSRIIEVAKSTSVDVEFVASEGEFERSVALLKPRLVILDLSSTDYDPFSYAQGLKTMSSPPKILGFFPHVRNDLRVKAEKLGIEYVVPNSNLVRKLRKVLENEIETS